MCGISGYIIKKNDCSSLYSSVDFLKEMASNIRHRGPDDFGIWQDIKDGIGLAHTRLAIVDVSPAGKVIFSLN